MRLHDTVMTKRRHLSHFVITSYVKKQVAKIPRYTVEIRLMKEAINRNQGSVEYTLQHDGRTLEFKPENLSEYYYTYDDLPKSAKTRSKERGVKMELLQIFWNLVKFL